METLPYGHPTPQKKPYSSTVTTGSQPRRVMQGQDVAGLQKGELRGLTSWDSWDRLFWERPLERRHHPPGQIR